MRMRSKKIRNEHDESPFSLSIGDLMTSLLFIFIIILLGEVLKAKVQQDELQDIKDREKAIISEYDVRKDDILAEIKSEFSNDISSWNAEISADSIGMYVRFKDPKVMFDFGKSKLKPEFKRVLDDFFPRYIRTLSNYKDNIKEIRIEGHTDSYGDYYSNMKLSQDRTRTVLQYCLSKLDRNTRKWAQSVITANGLSSSKLIIENGIEQSKKSRRVEFRIVTDAEEVINRLRSE